MHLQQKKTIKESKLRQPKARLSRILRHHAWKWSRSILKGKVIKKG